MKITIKFKGDRRDIENALDHIRDEIESILEDVCEEYCFKYVITESDSGIIDDDEEDDV